MVLTAGLVVGLPDASANDIAEFDTVFATDFVQAGYGGVRGGDGTATLTVTGVTGTVTRALLYWHGPTNSEDPTVNAEITFEGESVTGENIGLSNDNCWGFANSQAYRADVTSLVDGDGTYSVSELIKIDDAEDVVADINGLSLIVFFDDGDDSNNRDVVIFDGNDSNITNPYDADGWNVTLSGIVYESGTAAIDLHVADGQSFPDAAIRSERHGNGPGGSQFRG
ncbi:MAG: hypothetical protein KatS3mg008_0840 [Acidimicrobiales bacterium]|nr:MAG: hypothetical protein KatS3mg008_0840 [Acidimicrobiales bacterium]